MKKNILIISLLSTKLNTGVGIYLKYLISSLQKLDHSNQYFIICNNDNFHLFDNKCKNFFFIKARIKEFSKIQFRIFYSIWQYFYLNSYIKKFKIDVVHLPSPWFINTKTPTIVTVHDLAEIHFKKYSSLLNSAKVFLIKNAIKKAKNIIAVSKYTQQDIVNCFGKVPVLIENGFDAIDNSNVDYNFDFGSLGLVKKKYFIFIGDMQKHKNVDLLIEGFSLLNNTNYKMVLVGNNNKHKLKLDSHKNASLIDSRIVFTGYVSDLIRNTLLYNSYALILPSVVEGFGFPILEANSLGIPVISSDSSAMKEINNFQELQINPFDAKDLKIKMELLINDNELYKTAVEKGFANIKRFNWDACAEKVINLYSSI